MSKAPFERVFSLIERKKILSKVAKEKIRVLLKGANNEVMELKVSEMDSQGNLQGAILGKTPKDFEKVTALFYIGRERYFLTTKIKKKSEDRWLLLNDTQLFRFNRRNAFRVFVPPGVDLNFFVSTVRNIEINKKVNVLDFSSGGARLHWYSDKKLPVGTQIKGVLQWGNGKILPIEATIVHSPETGIYGVRFVRMSSVTLNRLKMLSVEIQQEINFT